MQSKVNFLKVIPSGFCTGVTSAYDKTIKIIKDYPNYEIYLIGWLVHNEQVIKKLTSLGVKILDDKNISRVDLVKSIPVKDKTIAIFSAHGTQTKAIELANQKNFIVYDLTCPYVKKITNMIREKIENGFSIIYIGNKNHPEARAIKDIDKTKINIVSNENDVSGLALGKNEKIFVTNQTTITCDEYENINLLLKNSFNNIEFKNGICKATDLRFQALKKQLISADLLIVVGSKKSNNCYKLYELGLKNNIQSVLIENYKKLDLSLLKNKHEIRIVSGTSTPNEITEEVINKINNYLLKESI